MENMDVMNGTQSLSIDPAMGGELMPVNQEGYVQPSNLEMAASLAVTMAVGYGIGKLGELLFDKVIGPAAKKAGKKFDERMARKKAKQKSKSEDEDVLEGEFKNIEEEVDPDENQDEQPLPKKGMRNEKAINAMRKKRKH